MKYNCGYIADDEKWKKVFDALKYYMYDKIQMQSHEQSERYDFIFIPLPNNYEAIKTIFRKVKKIRENDLRTPIVFFALNQNSLPDPFHPESIKNDEIKKLMGRQKFGEVSHAIFYGELIFKEGIDNEGVMSRRLLNVLDMSLEKGDSFLSQLSTIHKVIADDTEQIIPLYKEKFYSTFVGFYDNLTEMSAKDIFARNFQQKAKIYLTPFLNTTIEWKSFEHVFSCLMTKNEENLAKLIEWADKTYAGFNSSHDSTHRIDKELFCAPVPFPLQELTDAKKYIEGVLNGKKIKLLLIDNRSDNKFIKKNSENGLAPQPLCALIKDFGLESIFEIQMLGNVVYKKDGSEAGFYRIIDYRNAKSDSTIESSDFKKDCEEFNFKWFKCERDFNKKEKEKKCTEKEKNYDNLIEYHNKFIDSYKSNDTSINTYSDIVYQKLKYSHFILLDFFLNEKNTYLAFDFIKDISEIKKKVADYSTTWYFITSAVYDSVVKYSQSGLLAEYYESAVVNAGDDPTNKKRQIIFVYKLLIFIQSRLKSFKNYKDMILKGFHNSCEEQDQCTSCLHKKQSLIKKYLSEYPEIIKIFPGMCDERFKEIVELYDAVIRDFIWLPGPDWFRVRMQIESLNSKLKNVDKAPRFQCSYIDETLKKRANRYAR